MESKVLISWIKDNLITKTNKINSRKLNQQESFFMNNIEYFNYIRSYTSFLNTNSYSERIFCLLNDYTPKCKAKYCDNTPSFITFTKGYNKYCCRSCKENPEVLPKDFIIYNKTKFYNKTIDEIQIIISKYGKNDFDELTKIQQTKLIRYGDINYNNRCEFKKTLSKKDENGLTGFENRANKLSETLAQKSEEDKIKHYSKIVKTKKEKNSYKIGSIKAKKTLSKRDKNGLTIYEKRSIRYRKKCIEKYGVGNHNQKHLTNYDDFNIEYFIHNFVDNYEIDMLKAMKHYNCSWHTLLKLRVQLPNHKLYYVKNNTSYAETELLDFIPGSFKTRNIIAPKELDLYSPNHNFGIEYNGLMWHSFGKSKHSMFNNYESEPFDKFKHLEKTKLCEEKSIQLFHIFENEWLDINKQNIWKSVINSKLNETKRIFARKTTIKEVSSKDCNKFLNDNHLQGSVNSSIRIGLYVEDELISIMTFGKSRYDKKYDYELLRFCTKLNHTVVGGGSKLLKYFETNYNPKSLLSYANRRWSQGNLYSKLGFEYISETSPNYFYFKSGSNKIEGRIKYQKHKLKNILESYDDNLTESENMYNNDYRKIYDCGNLVFVKEY